jgi:hypothetical protein
MSQKIAYTDPVKFTVYGFTVAVIMMSAYYCLALWNEKPTGNLGGMIPGLGGITAGLLVPTKLNTISTSENETTQQS